MEAVLSRLGKLSEVISSKMMMISQVSRFGDILNISQLNANAVIDKIFEFAF
jgi:hypothetical protein